MLLAPTENTHVSINRSLDIQILVYTFNGILLGTENEPLIHVTINMNEPQKHA